VGRADVIIEASRPHALRNWGLDAGEHTARGATWLSITAGGRAQHRVGFGDDVAAAAGLLAWTASGPVFCGDAIADPLTGIMAAALVADEHAPGQVIDLSMTAVVSATLAGLADPRSRAVEAHLSRGVEYLAGDDRDHRVQPPRGRRPAGVAAQIGSDNATVKRRLGPGT
jgi:hypothetical protein